MILGVLALGAAFPLGSCSKLGGASDDQGDLVVFPDEDFVIAGIEGGPVFPDSKVYVVSNVGEDSLRWSAHSSHPSIGFSTSAGILASGESQLVTVFVELVPNLPPGRYVADIVFQNDDTGTEEADPDAVLTISAANALEITPSIGFSSSGFVGGPFTPLSGFYALGNAGSEPIDWTIEITEPWLSASLDAGQLAPASFENVSLSIDPVQAAGLSAANHNATVLIHDLTNGADLELIVTLAITERARLDLTPAGGFFTSGEPGGPFSPPDQTYTLRNTGSELMAWTAGENASWLTLSRTSGSLAPDQQTTVVASIDAVATESLADGDHQATITFTNTTNGLGNTTRPVGLTLVSPPSNLLVSPAQAFSSAGPTGGPFQPSTKTYTLSNNGGMTLNWQALASVAWLALAPSSGSLAPGASVQVVVGHEPNVAPFLGVGQYSGQITFTNLTSGSGNTTRGASLNVSAGGGGGTMLTPGTGFTGPTPEPGQIGSGSAKAIARWDVVPYQTIVEQTTPTFTVGVVAFHIAGIARVSFSLQGGPFVDANEMSLNPQTGVWEYCATIDASDFSSDQPIELRAIAYPNSAAPQSEGTGGYPGGGHPRLLDSLFLYVDSGPAAPTLARYCSPSGNDSSGDGSQSNPFASPWKAAQAVSAAGGGSADGGIVYMAAGDYGWSQTGGGSTPSTRDRWLTFRPAPGVSRDQVRIVSGGYPGLAIDRLRLHEVTLTRYVHGDDGGDGGGSDQVWLDEVICRGAGIGTTTHFGGWNPGFRARYWTNVQVSDDASSVPGGVELARNVDARRVQYGPSRPKLVVNSSWDVVNNGGTSNHPDFIHWNFAGSSAVIDNAIVYGVTATNIDALGIFYKDTGHLRNVALVNIGMQLLGSGGSLIGQNCQSLDHFLMLNCTVLGPAFRWEMSQSRMTHMSLRACHFNSMSINPAVGGDSVRDSWFDNNNFMPGSPISPGSNRTTENPLFGSLFTPGQDSPLLDRLAPIVPVDKDNRVRSLESTIGSVE